MKVRRITAAEANALSGGALMRSGDVTIESIVRYRVYWRSKVTGKTGYGDPMSWERAKACVDAASQVLPEIFHWVAPAEDVGSVPAAQGDDGGVGQPVA